MKEIIELWDEFFIEWNNDPKRKVKSLEDGREMVWKPEFYDFMQWLSEKIKKARANPPQAGL